MADETIAPATRVCTGCSVEKPLNVKYFGKSKDQRWGFKARCKTCYAAYSRSWRASNPDYKAKRRQAYEARKEEVAAQVKSWRLANRDRYNAASRAHMAKWREQNRERYLAIAKRHSDKVKAEAGSRLLRARMRAAIHKSLATVSGGGKSRRSWEVLVGYTVEDLFRHLERQFLHGMTWDNRGKVWEIDHIIPASSFVVSGPDCPEFKACWALTNLRPLWANENRKKRDNRLHLL